MMLSEKIKTLKIQHLRRVGKPTFLFLGNSSQILKIRLVSFVNNLISKLVKPDPPL